MPPKRLLFIPAYRCEVQIGRTIGRLTPEVLSLFSEVIVIDNRSPDGTLKAAERALKGIGATDNKLLLNDANYGLGGSHKVAFNYALDHCFEECVVLHGDDQGNIADMAAHLSREAMGHTDWLLGARFMRESRLEGYSQFRTFGNFVFNLIYSLGTRRRIYDLGSGLNAYRMSTLADRFYLRLSDDLTFNYHMILHAAARQLRMDFVPISWRELDQVSNAKLVSQSIELLKAMASYLLCREHYLRKDLSHHKVYTSTVVFEQRA